ncbi:unnamed protein product [Brachionus calyciflorus]|uniref:Protein kinase domain-containing protein n=1 Tax=Brachionus calyciflorus TaxID=104777 RepID=A0A814AEH3_9BILA|nr:unnamed protein product [Brachionus calyciflorus]
MIFDNKYKLEEKIDSGNSYITHRVLDITNGSFKALKLIHKEELNYEELEYVKKECGKLREKWSPNVIKYKLDFFEKGFYCILMENFTEGTLKDHLRQNNLSIDQILEWSRQLASGLTFLHNLSIIHCNLRPQNIFIKGKELKISGLCSLKTEHRTIQSLVYTAPEFLESSDFNEKVDVWSLGCIFYEMSEYKILFGLNCSDKRTLCNQILFSNLPMLSNDNILNQIIKKMLKRNPNERLNSVEVLKEMKILLEKRFKNVSGRSMASNHAGEKIYSSSVGSHFF